MHLRIFPFLLLTTLALLATGCASQSQYEPIFVDAHFQQSPATHLRLLPVIDARPDPKEHVDLEQDLRAAFVHRLHDRGYQPDLASWPQNTPLPPLPENGPDAARQKALLPFLPSGDSPVVIIKLETITNNSKGLARGAFGVLSVWILDPHTADLLWMDRTTANAMAASADPLIATLVLTTWNGPVEAVHQCLDELIAALPLLKK